MKKFLVFLFIMLCFSCSSGEDEDEEENFPDFILANAEYITSDSGREPIKIVAGKMEFYLGDNRLILTDASFTQNKKDSPEPALYGNAGYISLNTETQDAEMKDGVEIVMPGEDGGENKIIADDLIWEKMSGRMETKGRIYLLYEDSVMEGIGFSGNMNNAEFSFGTIINGELKHSGSNKEETEDETDSDTDVEVTVEDDTDIAEDIPDSGDDDATATEMEENKADETAESSAEQQTTDDLRLSDTEIFPIVQIGI